MSALSHSELVEIDRTPKRALIEEIHRWAEDEGRRWVLGGPAVWSKDELVSAVVRIRQGAQP